MKTLLWLDDSRNPWLNNWLRYSPIELINIDVVWVKSYQEFINYITTNGLPDAICFDHDLGYKVDPNVDEVTYYNGELSLLSLTSWCDDEKTGFDCAKWLVEYCIDNNKKIPKYGIQSSNPAGRENIDCLLKNFIKNCEVG